MASLILATPPRNSSVAWISWNQGDGFPLALLSEAVRA
jgi:hypothetical protein